MFLYLSLWILFRQNTLRVLDLMDIDKNHEVILIVLFQLNSSVRFMS